MECIEWWDHVDKVLNVADMSREDNIFYASLKQNGVGEYEIGVELNELEILLKNLKVGDEVLFCFKPFSKWPKLFLDFLEKNTDSLVYLNQNRQTLKSIKDFALSCERYSNVVHVSLKVIKLPIKVGWNTLQLLTLCLRQVLIEEVRF